jgi:hypothetical protein
MRTSPKPGSTKNQVAKNKAKLTKTQKHEEDSNYLLGESASWGRFKAAREKARLLSFGVLDADDNSNKIQRELAESAVLCGQLTTALHIYQGLGDREADCKDLKDRARISPRPALKQLHSLRNEMLNMHTVNVGKHVTNLVELFLIDLWQGQDQNQVLSDVKLFRLNNELNQVLTQLETYKSELTKYNIMPGARPALPQLCRRDIIESGFGDKNHLANALTETLNAIQSRPVNMDEIKEKLNTLNNSAKNVYKALRFHTFNEAVSDLNHVEVNVDEAGQDMNVPRLHSLVLELSNQPVINEENPPAIKIHLIKHCEGEVEWVLLFIHVMDMQELTADEWDTMANTINDLHGWKWGVQLTKEIGGEARLRWDGNGDSYKPATGVGPQPIEIPWPENATQGHCLMLCLPQERS